MLLRALTDLDAALAGLVVLLVLLLVTIRMAALRRLRHTRRFRRGTEEALGRYLAGSEGPPAVAGRADRAIFLAISLDALAGLRGEERDRLAGLLIRLGFARDATAALRDGRRARRRAAADTLAAFATPLEVPAVTAALADRDVLVRATCAGTLAEAGGENAVPAVTAVACRDATAAPGAVASIALALAHARPGDLAPLMTAEAPAPIRRIAVRVAAEFRLAQFAGLLQQCLGGPDDLAASAARGLGMIGEFRAVGALTRLAGDHGRAMEARQAAVGALGAIGDPGSVGTLERLLEVPEWALRAAAAGALAGLGAAGPAALRRAAASGTPDAASLAEAALDR